VEPVRQDSSFAEKQEPHPALVLVVPGGRLVLGPRRARSQRRQQPFGCVLRRKAQCRRMEGNSQRRSDRLERRSEFAGVWPAPRLICSCVLASGDPHAGSMLPVTEALDLPTCRLLTDPLPNGRARTAPCNRGRFAGRRGSPLRGGRIPCAHSMISTDDRPPVYGRGRVLSRLRRRRGAVTLITGDSGIGKSTVLDAALLARRGLHAAAPVRKTHSQALPAAVFEALAEAAAVRASHQPEAREIAERWLGAATRVGRRYLSSVPTILAGALIRKLESITGLPLERAITDLGGEAASAGPDSLLAKAQEYADRTAADTAAALLAALVDLADDAHVTLAVDSPGELTPSDAQFLADLAHGLSRACTVWVCVPTSTKGAVRTVRWLVDAGVDTFDVPRCHRGGSLTGLRHAGSRHPGYQTSCARATAIH
jgi:hypothetical protein